MSETTLDFKFLTGLANCSSPPPPRMTLEEYLDFVWETIKSIPPEIREWNQQISLREKLNMTPFRIK